MGSGDHDGGPAPLLSRRIGIPVAVFLASRLVVLLSAHVVRLLEPQPLSAVLSRWDGRHYLDIVLSGYPAAVPGGRGPAGQSVHAFFPGYPLLVRLVRAPFDLHFITAALVVAVGLGTVAAVAVWLLARDVAGEAVATRAVALFSFFPGAFVLGMAYSEGAFLAFAAVCLVALLRRRWAVAGLAAAAAGATRPTGLVLAACCALAAGVAVHRRREWAALLAPALAPAGFVAWSLFLEARTGSATTWVSSHQRGWGQGFDLGANTARSVGRFLTSPAAELDRAVCVAALAAVAAACVLLWQWRPPAVLAVYSAGIVAPAVLSAVLTSTPRFALTAFPLHIAVARRLDGAAFAAVLAVSAAAMVALMLVAGLTSSFTP